MYPKSSANIDCHYQECIMTSLLFGREEEEHVTGKISKQAEHVLKIEHALIRTSSQFHDLWPHNTVLPSLSTR